MATIQLRDVTKIFPGQSLRTPARPTRKYKGEDQAFAERVATRADRERAQQARPKGSVIALDHVDLTVLDGQTTAVIGPSGCGKTTLLRVVAGIETDYTGQILYDNQDMRDIPARERYIGMVFQSYALYPHFEGRGNLAFFFKIRRAPDEETEERIRITSQIMGIGFKVLLKRKPGVLSGGEQQRVAIGRAIVRNPHLFLFDEPFSNLDAQLRSQTRSEIKRLLQRFQITSIYVTHDQVEAVALADRIAVMREGKIEQVGTYNWLRSNPANAFVAGFVGSPPMNLFTGTISDAALDLDRVNVPLPEPIKAHVRTGQTVMLGVRPEEVRVVTADQPLPEGFQLCGTVEVVEPDFAHHTQLVYLRTGQLSYAATGTLDTPLRLGDEVEVIFPADKFYFFDGETGQRIR